LGEGRGKGMGGIKLGELRKEGLKVISPKRIG
jgi:hypothetical protein